MSLEKTANFFGMRGLILLCIGSLQLMGSLFSIPAIRGIGMASGASPAPKVFTVSSGLETFSADFMMEWKDVHGVDHSLLLTPEVYSQIKGPYNRRNVYGAMLAYGPILATQPQTQAMFSSVCKYAFTDSAPLLRELNIDPSSIYHSIQIRVLPKAICSNPTLPMSFEVEV